jgi:hypothetical protein
LLPYTGLSVFLPPENTRVLEEHAVLGLIEIGCATWDGS